MRAVAANQEGGHVDAGSEVVEVEKRSALSNLRRRRQFGENFEDNSELFIMSPAGRVASKANLLLQSHFDPPVTSQHTLVEDLLGDSLLGPEDIAVLLQAGLTSPVKGSTVVQLNQRMLLDLMASQPKCFATFLPMYQSALQVLAPCPYWPWRGEVAI